MITSIRIENTASFTGAAVEVGPLKKLNYFFGGNGSGKTTISRVIERPGDYPACQISWNGSTPLRAHVYNSDFVKANFAESGDLAGIFTLGDGNVDAVSKIAEVRQVIDKIDGKLTSSREQLEGADGNGGKRQELRTRYTRFEKKCWDATASHRVTLKEAFKGFLNSKKKLATRIVEESKQDRTDASPLKTLAELTALAAEIFGERPEKVTKLQHLHAESLTTICTDPILNVAIVAKENVDLGALVKKLANSDWMTKGLPYVDEADGVCPFCQQRLSSTLRRQLGELFDDSFNEQKATLHALSERYPSAETALRTAGRGLLDSEHRFLDMKTLTAAWAKLDQVLERNAVSLAQKCSEPSRLVSLDDIEPFVAKINLLVDEANKKVEEQNHLVDNLNTVRTELIADVWQFLMEELKSAITEYRGDAQNISKAIDGLKKVVADQERERRVKVAEIRRLEHGITSTKPTVNRINQLLKSYGFHSFHLVPSADEKAYQLVRPGESTDATKTLSEGERTLISFLYFFHLAADGNDAATGVNDPRIVVFDDPISSLDSNVLFLVSAMIRQLASRIQHGDPLLKQLLVLTHNAYFHKEVTYGYETARRDVSYWTVRKVNNCSSVIRHQENQVMTTYERLWHEVKRAIKDDVPPVTTQHTLRRILEHYFKLLGDIKLKDLPEKFNGADKILCQSLIKWAHDGSHDFFDDPPYTLSTDDVATQLAVFKRVFEESGHSAHYLMMMGEQSDVSTT